MCSVLSTDAEHLPSQSSGHFTRRCQAAAQRRRCLGPGQGRSSVWLWASVFPCGVGPSTVPPGSPACSTLSPPLPWSSVLFSAFLVKAPLTHGWEHSHPPRAHLHPGSRAPRRLSARPVTHPAQPVRVHLPLPRSGESVSSHTPRDRPARPVLRTPSVTVRGPPSLPS